MGSSGVSVSTLALGTMTFGAESPAEESLAMLDTYVEAGGNFIDTADVYADGVSEEIVGEWLRSRPQEITREMVLATKGRFPTSALGGSLGASRRHLRRALTESLRRLRVDHVDLYIVHSWDPITPVEETMEALDSLVRSGRVRALGASAMYAYQLHTMQVTADAHGWTRFSSMQNHYNLLYREDEREMIPVCRQYDMSLTPYSPLASGHLTRPTWDSDSVRSTSDATMRGKYDRGRETDMPIIERVAELAQRHHVAMADVALAWLWARGVAAPIVGCSRPSRVDDAVRALELTLTGEEIAFLEEPYVPHELVGPLARPEDVSQR